MEKVKRSKREWIRRYVSFVFILFVIAFGTSLSIRANLGSSPISAPPYVLSLIPGIPLTMGVIVICMHVLFILIQILLLRRNYELRQLSQILVSFLFGFYTDLTMWLTGFMQVPASLPYAVGYPLQFVELLIGGALLAFGIACEVRCDSLMLAGEGLPLAILLHTLPGSTSSSSRLMSGRRKLRRNTKKRQRKTPCRLSSPLRASMAVVA